MAEGLTALCFFFYRRYAFGSEGMAEFKIGPNKDVEYEVTLKDFQRVSTALSMVPSVGLVRVQTSQRRNPSVLD